MALETTRFDSADFLNSADDIAAYLETYLEDGTPEELRRALDTVARSHGVADLARRTGMTRAGIYKALGENGNPTLETVRSLLAALGLRFSVQVADRELEKAS